MKVDGLTFAVTLGTLWAAHDIADHVVQTDHQAKNKAHEQPQAWIPAMVKHVGGYQLTQAAAVAITLPAAKLTPPWTALIAGSLVSALSHSFIDRRWPVRRVLQHTGSAAFADIQTPICGMYQADQALHHGFLWIAALIIAIRR